MKCIGCGIAIAEALKLERFAAERDRRHLVAIRGAKIGQRVTVREDPFGPNEREVQTRVVGFDVSGFVIVQEIDWKPSWWVDIRIRPSVLRPAKGTTTGCRREERGPDFIDRDIQKTVEVLRAHQVDLMGP